MWAPGAPQGVRLWSGCASRKMTAAEKSILLEVYKLDIETYSEVIPWISDCLDQLDF